MFERFSVDARDSVVEALNHARSFGHSEIGSGHLLLGVVAALTDSAIRELLPATDKELSEAVRAARPSRPCADGSHHLFSSVAKDVLESSIRVFARHGGATITPAHILLALAQQERGVAIEVIEGAGVDLEGLRTHLELCIATEHQSGSERSQTGVTSENGSTPEGATATRNKGSLYAQSVEAFVETFIRVHCEIEYPQVKWCSSWRNHPQAELIFEGLWRSYEEARAADMVNAGGQNTVNYLVGHFYPLVDRLTGPNGPFVRCTPELCSGAVSLGEKRARRREVE